MPTCRLPTMTMMPNSTINSATPASTQRWAGPPPRASVVVSVIDPPMRGDAAGAATPAAGLTAAPLSNRLDGIVHRRVDVVADQLHRDFSAAAERDVGELGAGRLFQR